MNKSEKERREIKEGAMIGRGEGGSEERGGRVERDGGEGGGKERRGLVWVN